MYLSLDQAKQEIWKRWHDTALRNKVRDYVGEVPPYLEAEPRAFIARHVATPNFEFFRFARAAREAGLKPVCPEYTQDRFCTHNPDKLLLGKMTFLQGRTEEGEARTATRKVIDIPGCDGKPFSRLKTVWDEGFLALHHRLLTNCLPEIEVCDNSGWLKKMGGKPDLYWPKLLALFICHGILFDNFHSEGHEKWFTHNVIRPAFRTVKTLFGVPPLIVTAVPVERERDPLWSWYPGRLEEQLCSPVLHRSVQIGCGCA